MLSEKVVPFKNSRLYDDIKIYLDDLEIESKNTRIAYEKNIRHFFKFMKDKDIEHITEDDLHYKLNDIKKYKKYLLDGGNSPNTVNQKLASVKSLFKNLEKNDYNVKVSVFDVKRAKSGNNQYGSLSQSEADRMAEFVLKTEREFPYMKYCLILFATRTSFRLSEILSARWSDFEYENGVYKITLIGKRKKERTTAISEKLYNKMSEIKSMYNQNDNDIIFSLSIGSVNDMMKRIREKMNIPKERNIVFHSFRNIAIDYELETTHDVKKAMLHSGHANMNTMYKHYVNKTRDFSQTPGVKMDAEMDWSILDALSIDELKEFIKQDGYKSYIRIQQTIERNKQEEGDIVN